jgi:large subunit ribosomal protein L11
MAKTVKKTLKLIIPAGKATPAPPIGPAIGQAGINIGEFVKQFNDKSASMVGDKVTAVISVYDDRTFSIAIKTPPASSLILKAAGIEKGSGKNKASKAGSITKAQVRAIAEKKLVDLNAHDVEAAMKIIEGSARSMGVEVK